MGFMTDITILNDVWHEIKAHPEEFVESIGVLMNYSDDQRRRYNLDHYENIRNHIGYMHIHQSHHADDTRVMYSGQNSSQYLDAYSLRDKIMMRPNDTEFIAGVLEQEVIEAQRQLRLARKYLKHVKSGGDPDVNPYSL